MDLELLGPYGATTRHIELDTRETSSQVLLVLLVLVLNVLPQLALVVVVPQAVSKAGRETCYYDKSPVEDHPKLFIYGIVYITASITYVSKPLSKTRVPTQIASTNVDVLLNTPW